MGAITYECLQQFANNYIKSHRLEESVADFLRQQGVQATALPAKAHGRPSHAADVLVTLADGTRVILEVKEARSNKICLGLPIEPGSHLHGYSKLPSSLLIDSAWAWDNKVAGADNKGTPLLGALILVPIGKLSDDEHITLGIVYCPSEHSDKWTEVDTCNGNKCYTALKCPRRYMRTLADLLGELQDLGKL